MKRKGQNVSVELTLIVSIGISLIAGSVFAFGNYADGLKDSTREQDISYVKSEVAHKIYNLKGSDRSSTEFDLPRTIGGKEYNLLFKEDKLIIAMPGEENYRNDMNGLALEHEIDGSTSGGKTSIYHESGTFTVSN